MRVTCQGCETTFNLDESLLKPAGSKVRCSKCRRVFLVHPPAGEDAPKDSPATEQPQPIPDVGPSVPEKEPELSELEKMLGPEPEEEGEPDAIEAAPLTDAMVDSEPDSGPPAGAVWQRSEETDHAFAIDIPEISADEERSEVTGEESVDRTLAAESEDDALDKVVAPQDDADALLREPFQEEDFSESEELEDFDSGRRVHPGLLFLLIVVVIMGGVYWGAYWAYRQGMQISMLSQIGTFLFDDSAAKAPADSGLGKMATIDIDSKIIDNSKGGKLFVITGKIRNGDTNPHGFIRVRGDLYTKGQTVARSETVYCGNVISELDLAAMSVDDIKKRLSNRFGGNRKANLRVLPGELLPFMVVFDDLPEGLEEFSLEVTGSIVM